MNLIILESISKHTKDRKVTGSSQHGFNKGKSCRIVLIALCNVMDGSADDGRRKNIVYLNFSQAFDITSYCSRMFPTISSQTNW